MSNEIEITIYTNDDVRVSIDEWDDGGVWLGLRGRGHGGHCTLTRAEAQKMRDALDAILLKAMEVAA
jgi:hypothetical protein